jgi:hypothetical protein
MPALLKGDPVPNISDAILQVYLLVDFEPSSAPSEYEKIACILSLAGPVSKGAHQVAHLPQGRKTAQVKMLVLTYPTDYLPIRVSHPKEMPGSMGPQVCAVPKISYIAKMKRMRAKRALRSLE